MLERKVKTVRALERGLDVLIEVQTRKAASLHELHQATGLPKATLLRMLVTLGQKGLGLAASGGWRLPAACGPA